MITLMVRDESLHELVDSKGDQGMLVSKISCKEIHSLWLSVLDGDNIPTPKVDGDNSGDKNRVTPG